MVHIKKPSPLVGRGKLEQMTVHNFGRGVFVHLQAEFVIISVFYKFSAVYKKYLYRQKVRLYL